MKVTKNRTKSFWLSVVTSYGTIITSMGIGLVSVPIGLSYFGPVAYGVWLVISSLLSYLRTADFGIGLATLTFLAQASEASTQRLIIRRSITILMGCSIVFLVFFGGIKCLFPDWAAIIGAIPPDLQEEASTALFAIVVLTLFKLPTIVFYSTFSGLQKVYWNRVYAMFETIAGFGALLLTILVGGDLISLAIFWGVGHLFVGLISGVHLFLTHPTIRPVVNESVINAPSTTMIFSSGIRFLLLQISAIIILSTDNLVISHFLGVESVTPYAITFVLFTFGMSLINAPLTVLWPMYGKAFGMVDWEWINRIYNHSISLQVVGGGLVWIGGIVFSKIIITLWAGSNAYGGIYLAFIFGGSMYLSSFAGSNATLINALNPTRIVVIYGIIEAMLNLIISLLLVKHLGIVGVAIGTFTASLLINTWIPPLYIQYRTSKKAKLDSQPILIHSLIVFLCVSLTSLTVLSVFTEFMQVVWGIVIIILYLALSWWAMPLSVRDFAKNTFAELRLLKKHF